MKCALIGLALAAVPAYSQTAAVRLPPVAIYTQFQQQAPEGLLEVIQSEVDEIMGPMGVHLEWKSLVTDRGREASAELAVITFRGRCAAVPASPHSSNPGALGWTHISDGVVLPFGEIDCGSILRFVQKEMLQIREADRQEAYGRALGRVLAHELYHILAHTERHGTTGVAKATYTVKELLASSFHFDEIESRALNASASRLSSTAGGAGQ